MIVIKQRNEAALAVVCRYSGRCGSFYLSETTVLHSDVQITFNDILAHINVLIAGHQDCVLYLHMYARMVYACTHYRSLSSLLLQLTSLMRNVKVMALWHELGERSGSSSSAINVRQQQSSRVFLEDNKLFRSDADS